VFQAVSHVDAGPPLHPVVSLPPGVPPHELLLRRQTGGTGRPPGPQPQTGAGTIWSHKGAPEERLQAAWSEYVLIVWE